MINLFIQSAISGILQVLLFSSIPLIWWFVTARKETSFFQWLGIHTFHRDQSYWKKWLLVLLFTFVIGEIAIYLRGNLEMADSAFKGLGLAGLPALCMYAYVQTGLSEEILLRGFLLKRLQNRFGFDKANWIQALVFGALHLILVWGEASPIALLMIFVYPTFVALILGYLNEKLSEGSILPSWLIHGTLNLISGLLQLF